MVLTGTRASATRTTSSASVGSENRSGDRTFHSSRRAVRWAALRARLWRSASADRLLLLTQCVPGRAERYRRSPPCSWPTMKPRRSVHRARVRSFSDDVVANPCQYRTSKAGTSNHLLAQPRGIGRAIHRRLRTQARDRGFTVASDTEPWNERSIAAHALTDFRETEQPGQVP